MQTHFLSTASDYDGLRIPVATNQLCVQHCRACGGEYYCQDSHTIKHCHTGEGDFSTASDWLQKWFCITPAAGVSRLSAQTVYTIPQNMKWRKSFVIQMSGANEDSWIDIKFHKILIYENELLFLKKGYFLFQLNNYPKSTDYILVICARQTTRSKMMNVSVTSLVLWGFKLHLQPRPPNINCKTPLNIKQTISMMVDCSVTSIFLFSSQGLVAQVDVGKETSKNFADAKVFWLTDAFSVIREPVENRTRQFDDIFMYFYNYTSPKEDSILYLKHGDLQLSWNSAASLCMHLTSHLPIFLDTNQIIDFVSVLKHSTIPPVEFIFIGLLGKTEVGEHTTEQPNYVQGMAQSNFCVFCRVCKSG